MKAAFTPAVILKLGLILACLQPHLLLANIPPSVFITGWGRGSYSISPCAAEAKDPDGYIVKIEYFGDGVYFGFSTNAPYCVSWTNVSVGVHTIFAVATDNEGATNASAPVTVEMFDPLVVRILTPTNGQSFALGDPVKFTAEVSGGHGTANIYYEDSTYQTFQSWNGSSSAPYTSFATNLTLGGHEINAFAKASEYGVAYSTHIFINILPAAGFPRFTRAPTNEIFIPNSPVALVAEVGSPLPVSYQWYRNGVALVGKTNSILSFSSMQPGDGGYFSVTASNVAGVTPSPFCFLAAAVQNPATINFQNFVVTEGVTNVDAAVPGTGARSVVLWAGLQPDAMFPISSPTSVFKNRFAGGTRPLPFIPAGAMAYVQVRWGPSEEQVSNMLRLRTATNGNTVLTGLRFPYYIEWPEPAVYPLSNLVACSFSEPVELAAYVFSWSDVSYRWKKNGMEIPGASGLLRSSGAGIPSHVSTNIFHRVGSVGFQGAACYTVIVEGPFHTTTSTPILVSVAEPKGGRFLPLTTAQSGVAFEFLGRWNTAYQIETSSNLTQWSPLFVETNTSGRIMINDLPTNVPSRFYRASEFR